MKKLNTIIICAALILLFTTSISTQAAVVNSYEYGTTLSALSIQPQTNDLAQLSGTTNLIVKGAIHSGSPSPFYSLFNSGGIGELGNGTVIFQDGTSPAGDTTIHCDFDAPKTIGEVHIFSSWGDARVFTWFEVWFSTTGTNDSDYSYLGTATFGAEGDLASSYPSTGECLARLYDNADGVLADNVVSLMLIHKTVGNPNSPNDKKSPSSVTTYVGAAVQEIDVIGVPYNLVANHSYNDGYNGNQNSTFAADWNVGSGGAAGNGRIFDDSADTGTNCMQLWSNDQNAGTYSQTITIPKMYVGTHNKIQ